MGKSQRIRLRDIREIDRLVHECLEFWADPDEWRMHLVRGVTQLTNVQLSSCEHRALSPRDPQGKVVGRASYGWPDERTRNSFLEALDGEPGSDGMPNFEIGVQWLVENNAATMWRGDVVDEPEWHQSRFYQCFFEPAGFIDGMVSIRWDPRPGHFMMVSLNRLRRDPPFQARQRKLLRLAHHAIMPFVGKRLAIEGQKSVKRLTPRRREALQWLLDGLTESELAERMGISPATAHQYVGELYGHFGVNSRAQLMAYFIHRRAY